MTLESWHSQKNANQSINQSKINLPPPIRTHTYPARNGGYSWKEGRIVQLGTREREKERGKERGLQIGHIKSCSLCQERIFLLVVARDKQRSERVMVQRSLSVSPLPTQLLPRGWVKGRRGREGVESKEESGGGNCEEKVDGESVEIGGNACGWALTYSFSGPLGIVSLSPVSPTLHHPALWWSKVPKKGAAVLPPSSLRDQSIHWPCVATASPLVCQIVNVQSKQLSGHFTLPPRRFPFFFLRISSMDCCVTLLVSSEEIFTISFRSLSSAKCL